MVDLAKLSGAGVHVAVVDSGYSSGRLPAKIGVSVNLCGEGTGCEDQIGHGTACAGIIARKAPDAVLHPIKVFSRELVSESAVLAAAIRWCVEHQVQVVNLSLGTTDEGARPVLQKAADLAASEGIFLVAATSNTGDPSYPAALGNVFGVAGGKVYGRFDFHFDPRLPVEFIARGDRQRLIWLGDTQVFMGGTSFAAPHITAIIALLLEYEPTITREGLVEILLTLSLKTRPLLVDPGVGWSPSDMQTLTKPSTVKLAELHSQGDIGWIKRAAVYPFNKEMHSLVRFREMLPFRLGVVADVVGKGTIGQDAGSLIGADSTDLAVHEGLKSGLNGCDTLILGYLDQISQIARRDVLREALEAALQHGCHVYSLSSLPPERYPDLFAAFRRAHLRIASPVVTAADYDRITAAFDGCQQSNKPVVGVFGTSPQQGKFTLQLALRRELQSRGYSVGHLATEHQAALFGCDFTFPNGYDGANSIGVSMDMHLSLLQSVMVGIEHANPDLVLVGGQSGIVPYSYQEKSRGYTLSSLIVMLATVPDAVVLVVNSSDEHEFIEESIAAIKALVKAAVILLAFTARRKTAVQRLGRSFVTHDAMPPEEVAATIAALEERFGTPVADMSSDSGRSKIAEVILSRFAA